MAVLLALLLWGVSQSAPPASPPPLPSLHGGPAPMTCPVGGETFSAWQPGTYSTYGERPDGKPYSYLPFPFPVPECPGNKLIVFDQFTTAEVAKLTSIIATDEYKRLMGSETSYYRGYWLANRLGRPKTQALGLLLRAIWQVSPGDMATAPNEPQHRRYQQAFVQEVRSLGPAVEAKDRSWIDARAANAARQLGLFAEAETLRLQAERTLSTLPDKRGWDRYLAKLQRVIARKDSSIEPLDMIPDREVARACERHPAPDAFARAACAKAAQDAAARSAPK